jgi:hypothetical protein
MNGTIAANLFLANKESRDIFYQLIVVAPLDLTGTEDESKDSNGKILDYLFQVLLIHRSYYDRGSGTNGQGFSLSLIGQTLIRLDDVVKKTVCSICMYVCLRF